MPGPKKGRRVALLSGVALVVVLAGVVVLAWRNWDALSTWCFLWGDFKSIGKNAQGYPEYRHRGTGIVFVKLPGGEFWMGTSEEEKLIEETVKEYGEKERKTAEKWIAHEQPRHTVTLGPFLISKHEVCQAEWQQVMGSNPSHFKGDQLPVENVTWDDCQEFCKKTELRLPTEAEWEYACRAGNSEAFCFGHNWNRLSEYAWYTPNSGEQTHPVGKKKPNGFGLHDMHGNVLEWCEDIPDGEFYSKPEATKKDPLCTSGLDGRVLRGGCWDDSAGRCRSAFRTWNPTECRASHVGLCLCYPLR